MDTNKIMKDIEKKINKCSILISDLMTLTCLISIQPNGDITNKINVCCQHIDTKINKIKHDLLKSKYQDQKCPELE